MPAQTKIQEGPNVSIHYGFDDGVFPVNYFFYLEDKRLMWRDGVPRAVNSTCETFCEDGGGHYFELHVGLFGFGQKVSREVMAEIWTRFGVPSTHVDALNKGMGWS
jgi:hypothetical protein